MSTIPQQKLSKRNRLQNEKGVVMIVYIFVCFDQILYGFERSRAPLPHPLLFMWVSSLVVYILAPFGPMLGPNLDSFLDHFGSIWGPILAQNLIQLGHFWVPFGGPFGPPF